MTLDEWVKKFEDANIGAEELDDLVHNAKSDEASEINNRGLHSQIEYLLSESCEEDIKFVYQVATANTK